MRKISSEQKRAIAKEWLTLTLQTYPSQSLQYLVHQTDCFRNPVGQTLKDSIPVLVDELFGEMNSSKVRKALEDMVRIRAVQNFSARDAVGFVFLLKGIFQKRLASNEAIRLELDRRVDEMALTAFDFYAQCREKISDILVSEARRRVALLQRIYSEVEGR
ncbi:MAG TPA: RsbRD N-terminal domain-containing protein [Terriglobia bacterium]|nr:RsbRD N-terminal domain-containing protein [Terriglobia bacterium]